MATYFLHTQGKGGEEVMLRNLGAAREPRLKGF